MAIAFSLQASHTFPANVPVTLAALRKAAVPILSATGTIGTSDLSAGAVTPAKSTPGAYWYAAGTLSVDTYAVTLDPPLTGYANGVEVAFKADALAPATPKVNVNALGARKLYKFGGAPLEIGEVRANQVVAARYNSSLDGGTGGFELLTHPGARVGEYLPTDVGSANAYAFAMSPGYSDWAHLTGRLFAFKAGASNTGASTVTPSGLAAKAIKKFTDKGLSAGDIRTGQICWCVYDGTNVQLLNPSMKQQAGAWVNFNGTVVEKTVNPTVDTATERLTVNAHGIAACTDRSQATAVILYQGAASTVPTGTAENTTYYAFRVDANTVSLHTDPQGAVDGTTGIVNLTGNGAGANIKLAYVTAINDRYNIAGVVPLADLAADAIDTGKYRVHFLEAFASATQAMAQSVKNATATVFTVAKSETDLESASFRTVRLLSQNAGTTANTTSSQVELVFYGEPA